MSNVTAVMVVNVKVKHLTFKMGGAPLRGALEQVSVSKAAGIKREFVLNYPF